MAPPACESPHPAAWLLSSRGRFPNSHYLPLWLGKAWGSALTRRTLPPFQNLLAKRGQAAKVRSQPPTETPHHAASSVAAGPGRARPAAATTCPPLASASAPGGTAPSALTWQPGPGRSPYTVQLPWCLAASGCARSSGAVPQPRPPRPPRRPAPGCAQPLPAPLASAPVPSFGASPPVSHAGKDLASLLGQRERLTRARQGIWGI